MRKIRQAVQRDLVQIEAALIQGTWQPPARRRRSALPPDEDRKDAAYVEDYAEAWEQKKVADGLSPNTIRSYSTHLNAHIVPALGYLLVREITTEHVQRMLERMEDVSPKLRQNVKATLSSLLTSAKKDRLIEHRPELPTVKGGVRSPHIAVHELSNQQTLDLIAATTPDSGAMIAFASWCTMRVGEITALKRKWVDTEQWAVGIMQALKRDVKGQPQVGLPKSGRTRIVTIPEIARPAILAHLETFEGGPDDWLFPRKRKLQTICIVCQIWHNLRLWKRMILHSP